ncbi:MAG: hypothetical protein KBA81_04150 [Rhabdochlamydiaceae bacterium]|nr:hypothetical protein [Rhabdochlamydiaceae bacterium]
MSIDPVSQHPMIQHLETAVGRYSDWTSNVNSIVKNLNKIAVPAITFFALSNLPGVDGGPLAYAACVASCMPVISGMAGPAAITCFNWCLPLLPLPGP